MMEAAALGGDSEGTIAPATNKGVSFLRMLLCYAGVRMQCTGTVRIIAPYQTMGSGF
jgi:hypothetical protein